MFGQIIELVNLIFGLGGWGVGEGVSICFHAYTVLEEHKQGRPANSILRFLVFQPLDGPLSGLSRVLSSGPPARLMGFAAAGWYWLQKRGWGLGTGWVGGTAGQRLIIASGKWPKWIMFPGEDLHNNTVTRAWRSYIRLFSITNLLFHFRWKNKYTPSWKRNNSDGPLL